MICVIYSQHLVLVYNDTEKEWDDEDDSNWEIIYDYDKD